MPRVDRSCVSLFGGAALAALAVCGVAWCADPEPAATPTQLIVSRDWAERVQGFKLLRHDPHFAKKPADVDAVFAAIAREDDVRCFSYAFWPLQFGAGPFDATVLDRLLALLAHERPEVWYGAAAALDNMHTRWADREAFREKRKRLTGVSRLRLAMVCSLRPSFSEELQSMGEDGFAFLSALATYGTHKRCPELFDRTVSMLAQLGDKRAIPVLIAAIDDLKKNDRCENYTAPGYALKAINKLAGADYGGIGADLRAMSTKESEGVDWEATIKALRRDFGQ